MSVRAHALRIPVVLALLLSACAAPLSYGPDEASSADLLTAEELTSVTASNALDAVQQLRPRWLIRRDDREVIRVVVDGNREGDLERLRQLNVRRVRTLRFRDGREATTRYGTGYGAGVIEVRFW